MSLSVWLSLCLPGLLSLFLRSYSCPFPLQIPLYSYINIHVTRLQKCLFLIHVPSLEATCIEKQCPTPLSTYKFVVMSVVQLTYNQSQATTRRRRCPSPSLIVLTCQQCHFLALSTLFLINVMSCLVLLFLLLCIPSCSSDRPSPCRTVFNISANAHLENMNAVEQAVLDGTSKWSCKIAITGE